MPGLLDEDDDKNINPNTDPQPSDPPRPPTTTPEIRIGKVTSGTIPYVTAETKDGVTTLHFSLPAGKNGKDGRDGKDGKDGKDGNVPMIAEASATTLEPGDPATAAMEDLGDGKYAIRLGIPKGHDGVEPEDKVIIISLGTGVVTTLPSGEQATASVREVAAGDFVLDLGIPVGQKGAPGPSVPGPAPEIKIGDVITRPPNESAEAKLRKINEAEYRLDLSIPAGERGAPGTDGRKGLRMVVAAAVISVVFGLGFGILGGYLAQGCQKPQPTTNVVTTASASAETPETEPSATVSPATSATPATPRVCVDVSAQDLGNLFGRSDPKCYRGTVRPDDGNSLAMACITRPIADQSGCSDVSRCEICLPPGVNWGDRVTVTAESIKAFTGHDGDPACYVPVDDTNEIWGSNPIKIQCDSGTPPYDQTKKCYNLTGQKPGDCHFNVPAR